jgi:hypothetical protein
LVASLELTINFFLFSDNIAIAEEESEMSEDLDSFFAKRKTKAAKKKAIKLDDVAQRLESNLRMVSLSGLMNLPLFFQEDPEEFDEVPRPKTIDVSKLQEEDPEWIAFDTKPTLPFETVGVFNYTEQAEQQATAEERQQKSEEKAKTWKKVSQFIETLP